MVVPVLLCFGCLGFRDKSVRAWLNITHFLTGAFVTVGLSLTGLSLEKSILHHQSTMHQSHMYTCEHVVH